MASPEDEYQSPIITQILNSVENVNDNLSNNYYTKVESDETFTKKK